MPILLFIAIIGLLVLVHECGHFFTARKFGIRVDEFGLGFPPRLWGFRRGEVLYSINAIPFGGFVRIFGEQGEGATDPRSFFNASTGKKILVLSAGVIMNLILAWVILTAVLVRGVAVDTQRITQYTGTTIQNVRTELIVSAGGAADQAGLTPGSVITSINSQTFLTTEELIAYVEAHQYPPLTIQYKQTNDQPAQTILNPIAADDHPRYGIGLATLGVMRTQWYAAPIASVQMAVSLTGQTYAGFWTMLTTLAKTGSVGDDVSGPVGIAVMTGEISRLGWTSIWQFVAILSISLAVVNFFPIPALDGGRVLFLLIGKVRRRPIDQKVENIIHAVGFYLLLAAIVALSVRDVQRFKLVDRLTDLWR